jgi:hypothetical protein
VLVKRAKVRAMRSFLLCVVAVTACACEQKNPYDPKGGGPPEPTKTIGVAPDKFDCASIVTVADIEQVMGVPMVKYEESITPEPGTAAPCAYQEKEPPPAMGDASVKIRVARVQFDCREEAHKAAISNIGFHQSDPDAQAREVAGIGKKAVEDRGMRITALDDDTICAIYVVTQGTEPAARELLTKMVLGKLNESNQPSPPKVVKIKK